jgi:glycosyltransferase involved in cell wall biosynthesis
MTTPVKKKKILFLITKSNWGGAQRYVYDLATSLDHTKYEPVVMLGGDGELVQKLTSAGIRTISLQTLQRDISLTKEIRFMLALWDTIRSEQPDVLHVNSSKAGGIGCLIGRLANVPRVIFTAHGWAFNEDRPGWQKPIIKLLHWMTVLLSHKTIAVSNAMVSQMNWPLAQKKMVVINPGRTIPEFQSRLTARTTLTQIHPPLTPYIADVWLCIIAELHPIKQHMLLFTSMKSIVADFPHVRLVCIGGGELQDRLTQFIHEHNLEKHIFLVGPIHEAATLLKAADLFVLPSLSESYGYVLHEAGLAQVPIVASNVGGITDIISNETEGTLIDPTKPEELETVLRTFLRTPHAYTSKTQKLTNKLIARTVDSMTTQTAHLYETP